jgi:hypothetical protein
VKTHFFPILMKHKSLFVLGLAVELQISCVITPRQEILVYLIADFFQRSDDEKNLTSNGGL